MTSSSQAPVRRPRNRKAQIAETAAELFCARGFHNVGVDDIAEVVGITGPAIYRHFRNKQEILVCAAEELCALVESVIETGAETGGLDGALRAAAAVALDRRTVGRLYQWEGRHLPEAGRLVFAGRIEKLIRRLRDLLLRSRPALSKSDARYLVLTALSVLASPSTHRVKLSRAKAEAILLAIADDVLGVAELPAAGKAADEPAPGHGALLPRRERLLGEAVRLFNRHGYHEVGIEDIGAAAGINASSVYRHFPGKASLLAAVYYRAAERLNVATNDVLAAAVDAEDALNRLIESYVRLTFDQADLAAVYVSENENLPADDRHALRAAQHQHVDTWVRLVGSVRPGEPAAEVRFRVHAALNAVTDLVRLRASAPTGPERVTTLVDTILRGTR
ncbi:TetR/AcrR family transcriptional regulator [Amycolatopsis anabasis]|uniref:TetR/AcrR family transcriptional regulator n=1 Tax=Amycolatopsis anabasis TaxID=1840409 RepID=UPI001C554DCC|nr:TetR/AcrR family transcriptional regulator [Amycolatopsis anabasis]